MIITKIPKYTPGHSCVDAIKSKLKAYPRLYYFIVLVFGPMLYKDRSYKSILQEVPEDEPILNLGSGSLNLTSRNNIINLDICIYNNVDVLADAQYIPFRNNCFSAVINIALLEHIENPQLVVREIFRVLKPGGYVYTVIPFIFGYHQSPQDYYRWTREGIKKLFNNFEVIKIDNHSGPTSGLLSILQEWLSLLFSFQNRYLYQVLWIIFMVLLAPFKVIDFYLSMHPEAHRISASIFCICKKPRDTV